MDQTAIRVELEGQRKIYRIRLQKEWKERVRSEYSEPNYSRTDRRESGVD